MKFRESAPWAWAPLWICRVIVCTGWLFGTAHAATYHVAQENAVASDENPGSAGLPWRTIQHAAETLTAGDTVIVHAGVYRETAAAFAPYDAVIRPRNSGTTSAPIRYQGAEGESVVIDPSMGGPGFYILGKDYLIIEGFEIRNARIGGVWTTVDGSTGIQILNNHIYNVSALAGMEPEDRDNIGGVRLDGCLQCRVSGNEIHDVVVPPDVGNGRPENAAGVHSFDMEDADISANLIYNVYNGVMHKRSTGGPGARVRQNVIHDVTTGVYYLNAGAGDPPHHDQVVEQNHIYNCAYGIDANVHESVTPSRGFQFESNTLRCDYGLRLRGTEGVVIRHNLIESAVYSIAIRPADGRAVEIVFSDFNLFAPDARFNTEDLDQDPPAAPDLPTLADWQRQRGLDANSLEAEAGLRSNAGQQGWLLPGAAARGRGQDGVDIGAHPTGDQILGPAAGLPPAPTAVELRAAP